MSIILSNFYNVIKNKFDACLCIFFLIFSHSIADAIVVFTKFFFNFVIFQQIIYKLKVC